MSTRKKQKKQTKLSAFLIVDFMSQLMLDQAEQPGNTGWVYCPSIGLLNSKHTQSHTQDRFTSLQMNRSYMRLNKLGSNLPYKIVDTFC